MTADCYYRSLLSQLPRDLLELQVRLTNLSLKFNMLREVPPEIWSLGALVRLDLSVNGLESLPADVGQLTGLTELDVSDNQLKFLPEEIGLLTALVRLKVTKNALRSLPMQISRLKALETLDVSRNQLCLPFGLVGALGASKALVSLRIVSHLAQTVKWPLALASLPRLPAIDFAGNSSPAEMELLLETLSVMRTIIHQYLALP